jgi:subtilisin family serine protease
MVRRLLAIGAILAAVTPAMAAGPRSPQNSDAKLDHELRLRARTSGGHSRVILQLTPGTSADVALRGLRGTIGRRLASVGGQVADVPDTSLSDLARLPGVSGVSLDRRVSGTMERTGATIGSNWVRESLGFDGTGVGIAVIDSGVANWHDDLGSGRVTRFVDFVNFQPTAYDDYGHGTHVAGILAGNGHDSGGRRTGVAPGATLLVEKVLDASGQGYISNVIAAIDYAIANKDALNIRVINLSVAAGVYESYTTDPLTLAAKRAVEAGIVVVSAAGNLGKGPDGKTQYGAIGAPGNAPWVLTVGASSHNGTPDRSDDTVAGFSSRGPSAIDFQAKPDLVAPGVGIESLAEVGSTLFNTKPSMRLWGAVQTATEPYISLSGTSMAAPVVSGTIALMLQANPSLTPNLVKAILQFTAESRDSYNALTQGAGFLNARGAVQLAQSIVPGAVVEQTASHDPTRWSAHVIWGNHRIGGGELRVNASAWRTDVVWGSTRTPEGRAVAWGKTCGADADALGTPCDSVWGTTCANARCDEILWSTNADGSSAGNSNNVVWGTSCGGGDCDPSTSPGAGRMVAATSSGAERDNIVWGTIALDDADPSAGRGTRPSSSLGTLDIVWGAPAIRDRSRIVVSRAGER